MKTENEQKPNATLGKISIYLSTEQIKKVKFIQECIKKTMKTKTTLVLAAILIVFSSLTIKQENKKNLATPDQVEGLYIFSFSKPASETTFLGTVKASITLTGNNTEAINKMVKKARKEYPTAQAIIVNSDFDKADVISFK